MSTGQIFFVVGIVGMLATAVDCLCFKSGERNRKNRAWPEISDGGKLY